MRNENDIQSVIRTLNIVASHAFYLAMLPDARS